jgi:V/A-type H+-transporting ATPase subunit G/H
VWTVPLDAIKAISAAEDESRQLKLLARQNARDSIEEAQRNGEEAVAKARDYAESEIATLTRATDRKATDQALELASKTANRQATLRARAERRLDAAVSLIIERIVKV